MYKRKNIVKAIIFIILFTIASNITTHANSKEQKNILFINSYDPSFPTFYDQLSGIKSVLNEEDTLLKIEFMDSKSFSTEENYNNFHSLLRYKLNNSEKFDTVIVSDDNALNFAIKYQEELFDNIPIIFLGINNLEKAMDMNNNNLITGVVENTSIKETISLGLELNKNAENVVALTDNTYSCQADLKRFYNISDDFPDIKFKDFSLAELTFEEFERKLHLLDKTDIILLLSALKDKTGKTINFYNSVDLITDNCEFPIYHPYPHGIGKGLLGGKVISHFEQGKTAGELVLKILNGKPIKEISVIDESPNTYVFDYNMLKHFNINESQLPKKSTILNKELPFYKKYKKLALPLMLVFILLLLYIISLRNNIKKRKKAELTLLGTNKRLMNIYEDLEASEEELKSNYYELENNKRLIEKSEERYRFIFEACDEALWDYDLITDELYFSDKWYKIFGHLNVENNTDINCYLEYIHPDDRTNILYLLKELKENKKNAYSFEYRILDKYGKYRWIFTKGIVLRNQTGALKRIGGSHIDIHEKMIQQKKIENLAYYDTLTGLPNRFHLKEKLNSILELREENENFNGAVMFIDIDNFQLINDTFGHDVGDLILKLVGEKLKKFESEDRFVARSGGDEFVFLIKYITDKTCLKSLSSQIKAILNKPFRIGDNEHYITVSTGIALYPDNGNNLNDIMINSELAMYKAKETGKNRYTFYEKFMNEDLYEKLFIQNALRNALKNNEFKLYYQPQIDIKTGKIYGFEALIRWLSPEYGSISPVKFIPIAEEMGIIINIGQWILKNACEFAKKINETDEHKLIVSVNISVLQLIQNDFVDTVKQALTKTELRPDLLGIEITESTLIDSFKPSCEKLLTLKNLGIDISLDDFGTGYSSLNYLRQLPINKLKIDKSFIDDLSSADIGNDLIENIIIIAHKLNLDVVAEGVEVSSQLDILEQFQCDTIQGYLISKPLSEDETVKFIDNY